MKATRVWHTIGAVGISVGLASLILTTFLQWFLQSSGDTPAQAIQEHAALWTLSGLLAVFGPVAWLGGAVVVTALVTGRGWALTTSGGVLMTIGLAAGIGHLGLFFGLFGDLAAAGVDDAVAKAVAAADDSSALSTSMLIVFLIGFSLGPIVLTAGLRRARLVPVWLPVASVVAAVANFVGGPVAGSVQLLALAATFVPLVVLLARDGRAITRVAAPVVVEASAR